MLASPASTSGGLPSFWNKHRPRNKEGEMREKPMDLARQRIVTFEFYDRETVHVLPPTFSELDNLAREWTQPPPNSSFSLRVPVEFASIQASRLVSGPFIYLTSQSSYELVIMGIFNLRVEIVSEAPPPPEEPPPPPPPPVLEMPAIFNLEVTPGQQMALDVTVNSDELDMSRAEDGSTIDGSFWGKLDIVHQGDTHKMEFTGTRLSAGQEYSPDFLFSSRVMTKLATAAKPTTAKTQIILLSPEQQYCEVSLTLTEFWKLTLSWPPIENQDGRLKYFLRVHPGGALEHFESQMVTTALYYEIEPDANLIDSKAFIAPRNGFAMSFRDFIPHLMNVLDQLGLSLNARTAFVNNNISAFSVHKYIAYRFLPPEKILKAADITVTFEQCIFTRLFMVFRGLTEEEIGVFDGSGEKEANSVNWRQYVGWTEDSKDPSMFRMLETTVLDLT